MLNIFSCIYCLSVYLHWRNVHLRAFLLKLFSLLLNHKSSLYMLHSVFSHEVQVNGILRNVFLTHM